MQADKRQACLVVKRPVGLVKNASRCGRFVSIALILGGQEKNNSISSRNAQTYCHWVHKS